MTLVVDVEIERKFLVDKDDFFNLGESREHTPTSIRQGYIGDLRVRVQDYRGEKTGILAIKEPTSGEFSRIEKEEEIDAIFAEHLLCECVGYENIIEKDRYRAFWGLKTWEIDVYQGLNHGLIVAEVELNSEDEEFEIPYWIRDEVTHNPMYGNKSLATNPYLTWDIPSVIPRS